MSVSIDVWKIKRVLITENVLDNNSRAVIQGPVLSRNIFTCQLEFKFYNGT
jgi:hypothetical protein